MSKYFTPINYYYNKRGVYYSVDLIHPNDLPDDIVDYSRMWFKVRYNGVLQFDTIYISIKNDDIFDDFKKKLFYLYYCNTPVYIDSVESEFVISESDFRTHKVNINFMKVINSAINNMVKDMQESVEESVPLPSDDFDNTDVGITYFELTENTLPDCMLYLMHN